MLRKIITILVLIIVIGIGAWYFVNNTSFGIEKTKIDNTANQISEIKKIGQWEFLNVECEVLVDTIRERSFPFTDDRLARIYRGSLRLGIDLEKSGDKWIEHQGDSIVRLNLPEIHLLDNRFIDEANTITFYESGKWDGATKETMFKEAEAKMRAYALVPDYFDMARNQARLRFESLFKAIGFKEVEVNFQE